LVQRRGRNDKNAQVSARQQCFGAAAQGDCVIKVICLLKRRPGLSRAEFESYYEEGHAKIGEVCFPGRVSKYIRRYLHPIQPPTSDAPAAEQEFDVQMEMWFEDDGALQETMLLFAGTPVGELLIADEEKLFDRAKTRMYIVDERETKLDRLAKQSVAEIMSALGSAAPTR
jgi:hypothetical protein